MGFEEFVEQHCVHRVVAHGVDLAVLVAHDQVRVYLGYFLGDQTKLRCAASVALVVKHDRLKREDGFAGLVHRLNFLLEPARRAGRAKLAPGVYQDWYCVCVCGCNPTNVADKAAGAHVSTMGADSNNAIGRANAESGSKPQGRVVAAGVEQEGLNTDGRVAAAGGIVQEGLKTDSDVPIAGGVAKERSKTIGRVLLAFGVVIERRITVGCVGIADCVVGERISASGTIEKPAGVAKERINASGGVEAAIGIAKQGSKTGRRILVPASELA